MFSLYIKEIKGYFSQGSGYIAIIVFLLINGLTLWTFASDYNIMDGGFASLDVFFEISPWVFLILVPALTMRLLSEEIKLGTIELLYTRPLSDFSIVFMKYLASLTIILISILPTIIYIISIENLTQAIDLSQTANQNAPMDLGQVFACYLGLFFLAMSYNAIGIFVSSLTDNQITAFLISVGLCLLIYLGLDSINLGILSHYRSISRGVIDSRDIVYFLSLSLFFIILASYKLKSRNIKFFSKNNIKSLLVLLLAIIAINFVMNFVFFRIDSTSEKKYTLSNYSKEFLSNLKGNVTIRVYLTGDDLPIDYKRMKNEINDKLEEFRVYAKDKLSFVFVDPEESQSQEVRFGIYKQLREKGLKPVEIEQITSGKSVKTMIFPSAIICYAQAAKTGDINNPKDTLILREIGLNLLNQTPGLDVSDQRNIFNSLETLEYEFINAIFRLSQINKPQIAFVEGHGELKEDYLVDAVNTLSDYYDVRFGQINGQIGLLDRFSAVIFAKPTMPFSIEDKIVIDQYIQNGGNVLFLVDKTSAEMDSLYLSPMSVVMPMDLNMDDLFFNYGVRFNGDLIRDLVCGAIGLTVDGPNSQPQIKLFPWEYYPIIQGLNTNSISKHLDYVSLKFASTIDTVGMSQSYNKTVLLKSGIYNKVCPCPVQVGFSDINSSRDPNEYNKGNQIISVLCQGKFESLYQGKKLQTPLGIVSAKSMENDAKIIFCSDGDIIKNELSPKGEPYPLGFDRNTQNTFKGNKQFILNCINYLCGNNQLMNMRMHEVKIRLLDKQKCIEQRNFYSIINTFLPVAIVILLGLAYNFYRKKKYGK